MIPIKLKIGQSEIPATLRFQGQAVQPKPPPLPEPSPPPPPPLDPRVVINSNDDIQAIINKHAPGTKFRFRGIKRRLVTIVPRNGDDFAFEDCEFNGSILINAATFRNGIWEQHIPQLPSSPFLHPPQRDPNIGQNLYDPPEAWRDGYPNSLLVDGVFGQHVLSRAQVGPGRFFIDYPTKMLYFGDSPNSKRVELAIAPNFIASPAHRVKLVGVGKPLIVQGYASHCQQGAIQGRQGFDQHNHGTFWELENIVAQYNHGGAVFCTSDSTYRGVVTQYNGQIGFVSRKQPGDITIFNLRFTDCWTIGNGQLRVGYGWEKGGTKFQRTKDLRWEGGGARNNNGFGLWQDYDVLDSTFDSASAYSNAQADLFMEVCNGVRLVNLYLDASGKTTEFWGSIASPAMGIANCTDVEIINCILKGPSGIVVRENRQHAAKGKIVRRIKALGNQVTITPRHNSMVAGVVTDRRLASGQIDNSIFAPGNIVFNDNLYVGPNRFGWLHRSYSWQEWQALGHDRNGNWRVG